MSSYSGKQWERFLEYAVLARAKPTFDAEERDWKLAIADRMREALEAARDGGDWLALTNAVYQRVDLARYKSAWAFKRWFNAWAAADPESARRALAAFVDPASNAEQRFRSFARCLEHSDAPGEVTGAGIAPLVAPIVFGSVCNFAREPLAVPMVRPGVFTKLAQILGDKRERPASIADEYYEHLAFSYDLRSHMEESGLRVRDMIDVQSLIFIAAHESDFWAGTELHPIGIPPRRERQATPQKDGDRPPLYLSICAGYRNEAPYLQEWIEFHRLVGVDHFFLYDAHSTDNHEEVLAPYVESGIVTTHDWEGISHEQADTYNECLRAHSGESRWIAFIDCDEFLFSPTGRSLHEVLVDYEPWPGVGVNWAFFGRSGHVKKPPGLVIENYVMRSDTPTNMYTKSIVDPARAVRCRDAHQFEYQSLLAVDENHYPIHGAYTKSVSFSRLRINHYVTKSEEEARAKLGRPKDWNDSRTWRSTRVEDNFPQELDRTITMYLPALRAALEGKADTAPSRPAPRA